MGMAETGGKSLRSAGETPGITNHVAPDAFVRGNLRIKPRRTNASATTHSDQVPTKIGARDQKKDYSELVERLVSIK